MSRPREAAAGSGSDAPAGASAAPLLPLALLAVAVVAALMASEGLLDHWLAALAMLLVAAGAAGAGAAWAQQRHAARLRSARLQQQMLGQLIGQLDQVWYWETDAEHRLVRFQPPQQAPSSHWVQGSFSGEPLWSRFDDADGSLRPRLQSQAPVSGLRVRCRHGQGPRQWRLHAVPRTDGQGRFDGYAGVAQPLDGDDRQQAGHEGLQALLSDGPAPLLLARRDGTGWRLAQANPAARRLLGLADDDRADLPWPEVLTRLPDGLQARVQSLRAGERTEHGGWQASLCALGGAGSEAEALLLALAPSARAGADADEQQALRALADEHAAFSYTVSHDLRAPIRVVDGFARILKEDYGRVLDRVGNDHVDRVLGAAARMSQMIDALLSLSKLSTRPLARETVDLSRLALEVVDELRRTSPGREVAVHIAPGLQAQGDPTLLRLVLENLLGNAWKYSGKVARPELHLESLQRDGRRVFCVRDNGAGFDMRFAERLFGLFQRLHGSSDFPGTGVGLASVRRIVQRHGGEIWAESEVGQGARFYFTLAG